MDNENNKEQAKPNFTECDVGEWQPKPTAESEPVTTTTITGVVATDKVVLAKD